MADNSPIDFTGIITVEPGKRYGTLGASPKVILTRVGNVPDTAVESLLRDRYSEIMAFNRDPGRGVIELG